MSIPRQVTISPALNGYVVQVGCQQVVFTGLKSLLDNLEGYLGNPDKVEEFFIKNALHKPKSFETNRSLPGLNQLTDPPSDTGSCEDPVYRERL